MVQLEVQDLVRPCLFELIAIQTVVEILFPLRIRDVHALPPIWATEQRVEMRREFRRVLQPVDRFVHE